MIQCKKLWQPKINDQLEGILVNKLNDVGKYKSNVYQIRTEDLTVSVWGSINLDFLMKKANVGDRVLIRYMGTEKVNQHDMKKYELEIL